MMYFYFKISLKGLVTIIAIANLGSTEIIMKITISLVILVYLIDIYKNDPLLIYMKLIYFNKLFILVTL